MLKRSLRRSLFFTSLHSVPVSLLLPLPYHQPFGLYIITHWRVSFLRLDDIQGSALISLRYFETYDEAKDYILL